jgi:thiamine-phosphate pyrophosphorylase
MKRVFNPGLYAITPDLYPDAERLVSEVRQALLGGAAMIQFRDKSQDKRWRKNTAQALAGICDAFNVPLIINDDARLAARVGAAGVHLGRNDISVQQARALLDPQMQIGVSCYNDLDLARQAVASGADHLAFGSIFMSGNKPEAVHCPLDTLTSARAFGLPVVAIGGITPDNGRAVVEAGADSLAVIGAVFDAGDIRAAAESFSEIWER